MPLNLKNLDYFKNLTEWTPEAGIKLAELVQQISQGVNNIEQQTNSNATGQPQTPPPINSLKVTASNGHFQISIDHSGANFYRGINYFIEHSGDSNFTDPHTIPLGTSRNANVFLGNTTRYFRAFAAYPGSQPNSAVYHGGRGQPQAVTGGGLVPGPIFSPSQGSGTGTPGQGHQGFGSIPYRTSNGAPPGR